MTFKTLSEVRAANAAAGHAFFETQAMGFFNSKIESDLYGGALFVTSEREKRKMPPRFTIRRADADGSVSTVGEFQQYTFRDDARDAARRLAEAATA